MVSKSSTDTELVPVSEKQAMASFVPSGDIEGQNDWRQSGCSYTRRASDPSAAADQMAASSPSRMTNRMRSPSDDHEGANGTPSTDAPSGSVSSRAWRSDPSGRTRYSFSGNHAKTSQEFSAPAVAA